MLSGESMLSGAARRTPGHTVRPSLSQSFVRSVLLSGETRRLSLKNKSSFWKDILAKFFRQKRALLEDSD